MSACASAREDDKRADDGVIALSALDGATVAAQFVVEIDVEDATDAKLIVDGDYVGNADETPLRFRLSLSPGAHQLRVRATVDGQEMRQDASFIVDRTPAGPNATGSAPPSSSTAPRPPPSTVEGELVVDTPDEIRDALSTARPGDVILVADGEYQFDDRLVASASGTADDPITLHGSRAA